MRILGTHSVQSWCTLLISASYRVFVYGRYRKSRLVYVYLSDLDLSDITSFYEEQRVRMADLPKKNGKSGAYFSGREVSTQFAQPLLCCVVWSQVICSWCISRICYDWEFAGCVNYMGMIIVSLSTACLLHTQTSAGDLLSVTIIYVTPVFYFLTRICR